MLVRRNSDITLMDCHSNFLNFNMPPDHYSITSFNPDLDDWYSCHTSDDEAYQDALERNSVSSFYTGRGEVSTGASIMYTSIAVSSPARLADADQVLADMILEPFGDPRQQHEPPELDEEDTPVLKRTRSAAPPYLAYSPATAVPALPNKAKVTVKSSARRGQLFRTATTAAPSLQSTKPSPPPAVAGLPLRVKLTILQENSSIQVQILPAIFCFGDVPLPHSAVNADHSTVRMGPGDGHTAPDSCLGEAELDLEVSTTPEAEPVTMAKLDADCAVKLVTRPRGMTPCKPDTPQDQNKVKREVDGKERKKFGSGFPGFFLQRLFSGRQSRGYGSSNDRSNEAPLPPATTQELSAELLMASAAIAAAGLAAAAHAKPVVAGYVQTAVPAPAVVAATAPVATISAIGSNTAVEQGVLDEAATAAHRLSAGIFRNVLLTSADSSGNASLPKALQTPRDTAFRSMETRMPQRDQSTTAPSITLTGPARNASTQGDSRQRTPASQHGQILGMSQKQFSPNDTALELLVSLATNTTKSGHGVPAAPNAGVVPENNRRSVGLDGDAVDAENEGQMTPALSSDGLALDCGDLPMPELERCESPVAVGAAAASAAADLASNIENGDADADSGGQAEGIQKAAISTAPEPVMVHQPLVSTETSPAAASPRTVSKRAYGTVARLVKKIVPNFRDTTTMSVSTASLAAPLTVSVSVEEPAVAYLQEQQPRGTPEAEEPSAHMKTDQPGGGDVTTKPVEPIAMEQPNGEPVSYAPLEDLAQDDSSVEAIVDDLRGLEAQCQPEQPGQASPLPFVFGQEAPKTSKQVVAKARSFTTKPATTALTANDDDAQLSEAACRKRKAVDEILPTPKVPVFTERSSSDASEDSVLPAPLPEQPIITGGALSEPMDGESCANLKAVEAQDLPVSQATNKAVEKQGASAASGASVEEPAVLAPATPTQEGLVAVAEEQLPANIMVLANEAVSVTPAASDDKPDVTAVQLEVLVAEEGVAGVLVPHAAPDQAFPEVAFEKEPTVIGPKLVVAATAAHVDVHHSPGAVQKHEEPSGALATKTPSLETVRQVAATGEQAVAAPPESFITATEHHKPPSASAATGIPAVVASSDGGSHEPNASTDMQPTVVVEPKTVGGVAKPELQTDAKQQLFTPEASTTVATQPQESLAAAVEANAEIEANPVEVAKPAGERHAAIDDLVEVANDRAATRVDELQSHKTDNLSAAGGKQKWRCSNSMGGCFGCFRA